MIFCNKIVKTMAVICRTNNIHIDFGENIFTDFRNLWVFWVLATWNFGEGNIDEGGTCVTFLSPFKSTILRYRDISLSDHDIV